MLTMSPKTVSSPEDGSVMLWRSAIIVFLSISPFGLIGCQSVRQSKVSEPSNRLLCEQFKQPPQRRIGSYAGSILATSFLDAHRLGFHSYGFNPFEKNGIVYTCKAGHIDTYHVREFADWTAYLAAKSFRHLANNDRKFSFRLKEGDRCFVRLTYPDSWKYLSPQEKEQVAHDISIELGRYFSYTAATWHEILTWFGYRCTGILPEFPSAFSWEDNFSNLLGTYVGAAALRDTERTYNEAVAAALESQLLMLGARSPDVGRRAAKAVKGSWYRGALPFIVDMRRRHFDTGLDDGFVTPWIVPSIRECKGVEAQPYPTPRPDFLCRYGFWMRLEIEPRTWEGKKIRRIAHRDRREPPKRIEPMKHFPLIVDHIRKEARARYGPAVFLSSAK